MNAEKGRVDSNNYCFTTTNYDVVGQQTGHYLEIAAVVTQVKRCAFERCI